MRPGIDTPPYSCWTEYGGWYWATDSYILVRNDAPPLPSDGSYVRRWLRTRGLPPLGELLGKIRRSKAVPARSVRRFHIPTAEISDAGRAAEILLPYVERLGGECLYFSVGGVGMIAAFLPAQRLPLAVIAMARVPRESTEDRSW